MKIRNLFTCILALLCTVPAFALRIEKGDNVRISQTVDEDIYVFGGSVYIDAPVHGDLWCAGGTVTVNDTVTGDIVAAGGNIYLRGVALDDVRVAGGTLVVSGHIAGDLLSTGGTITVEPGAGVGGDVALAGGTAYINNTIAGRLICSGGTITLSGAVEKDFEFNGGDLTLNGTVGGTSVIVAKRIILGENASLRGNVRYWTHDGKIDFGKALQSGAQATFDESLKQRFEQPDFKFLGFASFLAAVGYLIAAFILIWIGQWLFPLTFGKAAGTAQAEPFRALGLGFLYFAAVPVGVVMLLVTVVGIPVGLIALFFYVMFLALANVITALVGAHWINRRQGYNWSPLKLVFAALGLFVLLKLLGFVPFVGWIAKIAVVFVAFGAILDNTGIFQIRAVLNKLNAIMKRPVRQTGKTKTCSHAKDTRHYRFLPAFESRYAVRRSDGHPNGCRIDLFSLFSGADTDGGTTHRKFDGTTNAGASCKKLEKIRRRRPYIHENHARRVPLRGCGGFEPGKCHTGLRIRNAVSYICISTRGAGGLGKVDRYPYEQSSAQITGAGGGNVPHTYRVREIKKILYASDMENLERETDTVSALAAALNIKWTSRIFISDRNKLDAATLKEMWYNESTIASTACTSSFAATTI